MTTPMTSTRSVTHKNKVTSWTETVTLTRKPASIDRHRMAVYGDRPGERTRARWFNMVEPHIVECFEVTATTVIQHRDGEARTLSTETFFEVVTTFARFVVMQFRDYSSIDVVIPHRGGPALCLGFWSKRGHKVGHARSYAVGMGINPDSKKQADHTCPAKAEDFACGNFARWGAS